MIVEKATHDDFNDENVSDMAGFGYEQESFRGERSLDEKLEQDGHRDGRQNYRGEVFKGKDLEVDISQRLLLTLCLCLT